MDLKLDQKRYRVFVDESYATETDTEARREKWRYYELRGKYGTIYPYSATQLAVYFNTKKVSNPFIKRAGWVKKQDGDSETVFWIPDSYLELAANTIKARKRRVISPEMLATLVNRLKKGVKTPTDVEQAKLD